MGDEASQEPAGVASISFGFAGNTGETTEIVCERGTLRISTPAHAPTTLTVVDRAADPSARPGCESQQSTEVFEFPLQDLPYHSWAEPRLAMSYPHVEGCLVKGLLESPLYSLEETITVARIMVECLE